MTFVSADFRLFFTNYLIMKATSKRIVIEDYMM